MPIKGFFNGPIDFGEKRIGTLIKKELDKQAKAAEKLLLKPTSTWNHKPAFTTNNSGDQVEVVTEDAAYFFVDGGTQPHPIDGNPNLVFQENYKPKSVVNSLNAVNGGKSGNFNVIQHVEHPGSDARNFVDTAMKIIEPNFQNGIDDAIDKSNP